MYLSSDWVCFSCSSCYVAIYMLRCMGVVEGRRVTNIYVQPKWWWRFQHQHWCRSPPAPPAPGTSLGVHALLWGSPRRHGGASGADCPACFTGASAAICSPAICSATRAFGAFWKTCNLRITDVLLLPWMAKHQHFRSGNVPGFVLTLGKKGEKKQKRVRNVCVVSDLTQQLNIFLLNCLKGGWLPRTGTCGGRNNKGNRHSLIVPCFPKQFWFRWWEHSANVRQTHMTLVYEEVRPHKWLHRENFYSSLHAVIMVAPGRVYWGQAGLCAAPLRSLLLIESTQKFRPQSLATSFFRINKYFNNCRGKKQLHQKVWRKPHPRILYNLLLKYPHWRHSLRSCADTGTGLDCLPPG